MRSLATLIKLQKTRVDEQRLVLSRLQDRLGQIEKTIADLEQQKLDEQTEVKKNPAQAVTYGEFIKWSIKHGHSLENERRLVGNAVNTAHDMLTELFEEQKRYEIAEAARIAAEEREEIKRETQELDEIGSVSFMRKKGE